MMAGLGPGVLVQNAWPSAAVVRTPGRSWKILGDPGGGTTDHGFALCHYGAELTCDHEGRSNVHVP